MVGDETPEDLKVEGVVEEASVWVFAFGSNMKKDVLEGRRMIKPAESIAAIVPGYMLTFNQPGLPYREPGFATIEPLDAAYPGSRPVHGVAHLMTPTEWEYYKESEGAVGQSDQGYGVIEVDMEAYDGRKLKAYTLMTQPKSIASLRGEFALPSKRYLNLLRTGAAEHNLDPDYQKYLNDMAHYEPHGVGGKIGSVLMGAWAFGLLFPAFGFMRMYRKMMGLHSVNKKGIVSKFYSKYFRFVFNVSWNLHWLLRPVLGCGIATKPLALTAPPSA